MVDDDKIKRRMTEEQEFELMKLVFDKFLWLGFGVMAYGLYKMIAQGIIRNGLYFLLSGIVILLVLVGIIIKEYEIRKK